MSKQKQKEYADYAELVQHHLSILAQMHADGKDITPEIAVDGLSLNHDNRRVRDYAKTTLKIQGSVFDSALRYETATKMLKKCPSIPTELVALMAKKYELSVTYSGLIRKREEPYIPQEDGTKKLISPHLWDTDDFRTIVKTQFHCVMGFDEFMREVRILSRSFSFPFSANDLNDASEQWYRVACAERLWRIVEDIECRHLSKAEGQADLKRLADTCFDSEFGSEFVVAVFNKFIWQVKRKIFQMPVTDHLMPVLLGDQGTGKSTLIRMLLQPVEELHAMTDFKQITDDRNISLWRNFIIFLDEMGWASKSDMDTVKNIITAPTLTRRIMKTNITQEIVQNATFIGAANAGELAELIRDVSGTRRFVSLHMKSAPDHSAINAIDWTMVWQSVDHKAPDPMIPFKQVLRTTQEADRTTTPIETWLDLMSSRSSDGHAWIEKDWTPTQLHTEYREFEQIRFAGNRPTSIVVFGREMSKLCQKPDSKFCRESRQNGFVFVWKG